MPLSCFKLENSISISIQDEKENIDSYKIDYDFYDEYDPV